jgi:hypothetical protein
MKRATISLIMVKSCKASLRMLLVCISIYRISGLRYKFLILDAYHPDTLQLCEQRCEHPWLFFRAKRGPRAKMFGKHWSSLFIFCQPVGMFEGEEPLYGEHTGLLGSGLATCLTKFQLMKQNAQYGIYLDNVCKIVSVKCFFRMRFEMLKAVWRSCCLGCDWNTWIYQLFEKRTAFKFRAATFPKERRSGIPATFLYTLPHYTA